MSGALVSFLTSEAAKEAIGILIANAPQALKTGEQVFAWVGAGIEKVIAEFDGADAPATVADVQALLTTEALQELQIEALK